MNPLSPIIFLLVLGSVSAGNSTGKPLEVFCTLCEEGLALIDEQLNVLEKLTDEDLGSLVDLLCAHAPRSLPIVDSLCVVLRDDLVAALTKLVQGLRVQLSPKHICTLIPSCVEK